MQNVWTLYEIDRFLCMWLEFRTKFQVKVKQLENAKLFERQTLKFETSTDKWNQKHCGELADVKLGHEHFLIAAF